MTETAVSADEPDAASWIAFTSLVRSDARPSIVDFACLPAAVPGFPRPCSELMKVCVASRTLPTVFSTADLDGAALFSVERACVSELLYDVAAEQTPPAQVTTADVCVVVPLLGPPEPQPATAIVATTAFVARSARFMSQAWQRACPRCSSRLDDATENGP